MNVHTHNTATAPGATDAKQLAALKDLEGPICDAMNMAGLVTNFFDGCRYEIDGDSAVMRMTASEFNQLAFGLYDLERRVKDLGKAFYYAFSAEAAE